jgi:hypothetical protein
VLDRLVRGAVLAQAIESCVNTWMACAGISADMRSALRA